MIVLLQILKYFLENCHFVKKKKCSFSRENNLIHQSFLSSRVREILGQLVLIMVLILWSPVSLIAEI